MIYSELRNYLIYITSDDIVELFDKATHVFDKYNVEDYMNDFNNIINNNSEDDSVVHLDKLRFKLKSILESLLDLQGVILNDDCTLFQLIEITDALYEIPFYNDKIILQDVLESDESDDIKFCQLMNLQTVFTVEEVLSMLYKLNEMFIDNFKKQVIIVRETYADLDKIKEHVDAYTRFKELVLKHNSGYSDKFFDQASSIGLPYIDYIKQYIVDKAGLLQDTSTGYVEQIAEDLVGLTTLSYDGVKNPLLVIRKHLSDIYPDITDTTKVDIAISKVVLKFTQ